MESILNLVISLWRFTPLEIIPRCFAAGLNFRIIPAGFNAPLGFELQRLEFLTRYTRPERLQHMSEKIEIRSVEMVRRIRDELADILKDKSHPEIIEFFKKAGDVVRKECKRSERIQTQRE